LGRVVRFYLPGMFTQFGKTGRYPGVSITGPRCQLMCDHCRAKIIEIMPDCSTPEKLIKYARNAESEGAFGMLVSGGSDAEGRLPWAEFSPALKFITDETNLFISVHCGFPTKSQMSLLKSANINQALIDVIGNDIIAKYVYHLPPGIAWNAVINAFESGIEIVPHVLVGLNYGNYSNEEEAIDLISQYKPKRIVIIALRPTKGTPMHKSVPPSPGRVAKVIRYARMKFPTSIVNLGCARPVGLHKRKLDKLAIMEGVDGIAVPSSETMNWAEENGFQVIEQPTCCSMPPLSMDTHHNEA